MNNYYNKELRERSRAIRNHARSISERILWNAILNRGRLGVKFKRQRPIGNYIVDFFAAEILLIVEIEPHSEFEAFDYNVERQRWLEDCGYSIVRFTEKQVLDDFRSVREALLNTVSRLKDSAASK